MQVMANVLKQGARFGGLGGTGPRVASASRRYLDLVAGSGDFILALAICEACPPGEVDELSLLMFRVFEGSGNLLGLLKLLVEKEVEHTSELRRAWTRSQLIQSRSCGGSV
jgi:neurofibromin 1